ncbi:uncharacterized protein LOC132199023 [Neocloeon triangulifer]|uniref:uncharacterized protein LOC132199023 n=1 Tax=Neocloeon triangulifer TaxID=2078957 RepID=UPI00286F1290|nr:uncharacterized protein LOC132199023 [Neocloeon triangulifer]
MKMLVMLLACQTLAAPSPTGPFALVREAVAESLPAQALKAIGDFVQLPFGEDHEEEEATHEEVGATHELISLSEYPVWRLHHYNKLEILPVPSEELANNPTAQMVPHQVAAEYAPPQEVMPVYENPAEAFYGDNEEVDQGRLAMLTPILGVAEEVRKAVNFVTNIPKNILSFVGFPVGDEEESEEVIPEVPEIKVPLVTKLPVKLPVLTAEHRKPPTYVVVNKLVPEKIVKKPIAPVKVAKIEVKVPKVVAVDIPKKIVPEKPKKEIIIGKKKPFVKPISIPKPILLKKPLDSKSVLVPASTIFVQEAPKLPESYTNAEHVNAALGASQVGISNGATRVPSDVQNLPRLVQASVQALGNVNSIGEVADAIETYNELGGLISRSDSDFLPSSGFATKKIDLDTIRLAQKPKPEEGHVAKSEPQRSSAPADFKPSPIDPIVVLPVGQTTTTTPATTEATTEQIVPDASQ